MRIGAAWPQIRERLRGAIGKYRIPILAGLLGLTLLLWPQKGGTAGGTPSQEQAVQPSAVQTQEELCTLLAQIDGVGRVQVMLTLADDGELFYQTDETVRDGERQTETVLADKAPIRIRRTAPRYLGAAVVCEGAERPAVQLAVKTAVASVTGLGSDKITVIKMKGQ